MDVLGIIVGQFKLERTKPGAFFFISPAHRSSIGNGRDYQDAFLSQQEQFVFSLHSCRTEQTSLVLKILASLFQADDSRREIPNI